MRVCLVTLDYPPFRSSGLTIYAENVARGLTQRGHVVTLLAAGRPLRRAVESAPMQDKVRVVRVPIGNADWIGLGWQAARFLAARQTDFDIVHFADVHFAYAYRGTFLASAFQSFRQRMTSNGGRPYYTSRRDYAWRMVYYTVARLALEQPSVLRATHLLMPSRATECEFMRHYRLVPERSTLVYLGIDLARYADLPSREQARRRLGLPLDVPILLYVGFSTPRKGLEHLAKAMDALTTPAHLVMVGSWDKDYRARFLSTLGQAQDRVHLTGYVPDGDLLAYYAAADVLVLPTLLEGFGIPLVEAMATGLPLVTTSGGSAGEVAGEAGLVVPPGDSAALRTAIERIVREPDLADRLRQAGHQRVRELFTLQRMAATIEDVYQRAVRT